MFCPHNLEIFGEGTTEAILQKSAKMEKSKKETFCMIVSKGLCAGLQKQRRRVWKPGEGLGRMQPL